MASSNNGHGGTHLATATDAAAAACDLMAITENAKVNVPFSRLMARLISSTSNLSAVQRALEAQGVGPTAGTEVKDTSSKDKEKKQSKQGKGAAQQSEATRHEIALLLALMRKEISEEAEWRTFSDGLRLAVCNFYMKVVDPVREYRAVTSSGGGGGGGGGFGGSAAVTEQSHARVLSRLHLLLAAAQFEPISAEAFNIGVSSGWGWGGSDVPAPLCGRWEAFDTRPFHGWAHQLQLYDVGAPPAVPDEEDYEANGSDFGGSDVGFGGSPLWGGITDGAVHTNETAQEVGMGTDNNSGDNSGFDGANSSAAEAAEVASEGPEAEWWSSLDGMAEDQSFARHSIIYTAGVRQRPVVGLFLRRKLAILLSGHAAQLWARLPAKIRERIPAPASSVELRLRMRRYHGKRSEAISKVIAEDGDVGAASSSASFVPLSWGPSGRGGDGRRGSASASSSFSSFSASFFYGGRSAFLADDKEAVILAEMLRKRPPATIFEAFVVAVLTGSAPSALASRRSSTTGFGGPVVRKSPKDDRTASSSSSFSNANSKAVVSLSRNAVFRFTPPPSSEPCAEDVSPATEKKGQQKNCTFSSSSTDGRKDSSSSTNATPARSPPDGEKGAAQTKLTAFENTAANRKSFIILIFSFFTLSEERREALTRLLLWVLCLVAPFVKAYADAAATAILAPLMAAVAVPRAVSDALTPQLLLDLRRRAAAEAEAVAIAKGKVVATASSTAPLPTAGGSANDGSAGGARGILKRAASILASSVNRNSNSNNNSNSSGNSGPSSAMEKEQRALGMSAGVSAVASGAPVVAAPTESADAREPPLFSLPTTFAVGADGIDGAAGVSDISDNSNPSSVWTADGSIAVVAAANVKQPIATVTAKQSTANTANAAGEKEVEERGESGKAADKKGGNGEDDDDEESFTDVSDSTTDSGFGIGDSSEGFLLMTTPGSPTRRRPKQRAVRRKLAAMSSRGGAAALYASQHIGGGRRRRRSSAAGDDDGAVGGGHHTGKGNTVVGGFDGKRETADNSGERSDDDFFTQPVPPPPLTKKAGGGAADGANAKAVAANGAGAAFNSNSGRSSPALGPRLPSGHSSWTVGSGGDGNSNAVVSGVGSGSGAAAVVGSERPSPALSRVSSSVFSAGGGDANGNGTTNDDDGGPSHTAGGGLIAVPSIASTMRPGASSEGGDGEGEPSPSPRPERLRRASGGSAGEGGLAAAAADGGSSSGGGRDGRTHERANTLEFMDDDFSGICGGGGGGGANASNVPAPAATAAASASPPRRAGDRPSPPAFMQRRRSSVLSVLAERQSPMQQQLTAAAVAGGGAAGSAVGVGNRPPPLAGLHHPNENSGSFAPPPRRLSVTAPSSDGTLTFVVGGNHGNNNGTSAVSSPSTDTLFGAGSGFVGAASSGGDECGHMFGHNGASNGGGYPPTTGGSPRHPPSGSGLGIGLGDVFVPFGSSGPLVDLATGGPPTFISPATSFGGHPQGSGHHSATAAAAAVHSSAHARTPSSLTLDAPPLNDGRQRGHSAVHSSTSHPVQHQRHLSSGSSPSSMPPLHPSTTPPLGPPRSPPRQHLVPPTATAATTNSAAGGSVSNSLLVASTTSSALVAAAVPSQPQHHTPRQQAASPPAAASPSPPRHMTLADLQRAKRSVADVLGDSPPPSSGSMPHLPSSHAATFGLASTGGAGAGMDGSPSSAAAIAGVSGQQQARPASSADTAFYASSASPPQIATTFVGGQQQPLTTVSPQGSPQEGVASPVGLFCPSPMRAAISTSTAGGVVGGSPSVTLGPCPIPPQQRSNDSAAAAGAASTVATVAVVVPPAGRASNGPRVTSSHQLQPQQQAPTTAASPHLGLSRVVGRYTLEAFVTDNGGWGSFFKRAVVKELVYDSVVVLYRPRPRTQLAGGAARRGRGGGGGGGGGWGWGWWGGGNNSSGGVGGGEDSLLFDDGSGAGIGSSFSSAPSLAAALGGGGGGGLLPPPKKQPQPAVTIREYSNVPIGDVEALLPFLDVRLPPSAVLSHWFQVAIIAIVGLIFIGEVVGFFFFSGSGFGIANVAGASDGGVGSSLDSLFFIESVMNISGGIGLSGGTVPFSPLHLSSASTPSYSSFSSPPSAHRFGERYSRLLTSIVMLIALSFRLRTLASGYANGRSERLRQISEWREARREGSDDAVLSKLATAVSIQETKEMLLAYFFLWRMGPMTAADLQRRVHAFMAAEFAIEDLCFDIVDALIKLEGIGLVRDQPPTEAKLKAQEAFEAEAARIRQKLKAQRESEAAAQQQRQNHFTVVHSGGGAAGRGDDGPLGSFGAAGGGGAPPPPPSSMSGDTASIAAKASHRETIFEIAMTPAEWSARHPLSQLASVNLRRPHFAAAPSAAPSAAAATKQQQQQQTAAPKK